MAEENKELMIFNNEEFGDIRTVEKDGEVWFVGSDLAKILGFRDGYTALRYVDEEDKVTLKACTPGGDQTVTTVNESGLYTLVIKSKKQEAKKFRRWVTSEVLPTIRKTGTYTVPKSPELLLAEAVIMAQKVIDEKEAVIQKQHQLLLEVEPKADYCDKILQSKSTMNISQIAKDYGLTGKTLNKILHEQGVQYRNNGQWLLYNKYTGKGYTKSKTHDRQTSYGSILTDVRTVWTQKGRLLIHDFLTQLGYTANPDTTDE